MTVDFEVKINNSLYKKLNKTIYAKCLNKALGEGIKWCESECRKKAPVITGTLRDHHSYKLEDGVAEVRNNCGYAGYVAFGTSIQKAQNYPLAIVKDMDNQKLVPNLYTEYLKKEGVTK